MTIEGFEEEVDIVVVVLVVYVVFWSIEMVARHWRLKGIG